MQSPYFRRKDDQSHWCIVKDAEFEARVSTSLQGQDAGPKARVLTSLQCQDAGLKARISTSLQYQNTGLEACVSTVGHLEGGE